jgi:hypothetical protein
VHSSSHRHRPALAHIYVYVSDLGPFSTPQLFYTYFYNQAHRLRLEKLLYLELSRSSNGFFKPLLDQDDGFTSETAERRFPFGCNSNVTAVAVAVGQSQRLYSGIRVLTGNYLSFLYSS